MTRTIMDRRQTLRTLAGTAIASSQPARAASATGSAPRCAMGIVSYALKIHRQHRWSGRHAKLSPALALLEETRRLGGGGIQIDLVKPDLPHLDELQERAGRYGMHMEAIVRVPGNDNDLPRFEQDLRNAKAAGANLARTTIIPGRRYERFKTIEEFHRFEQLGREALERAAPVLARQRFHLAVENHKDQRTWERLALLQRIDSEHIGLCVDVGNNFALMEDPLEAVRAFAPHALTVHLKDQAVRATDSGFLLADAALGEGFLDLPAMVTMLRAAKPDIRFNLETITRDPIPVPILSDGFWATMRDTPAQELARVMRLLAEKSHPRPFPEVSGMTPAQQLDLELRNVQQSLRHASESLGL